MNAVCPSCGSSAIDLDKYECFDCRIGLPVGSFDVRPRMRSGRAGMRAYRTQGKAARSDDRTSSIVGYQRRDAQP